MTRYFSGFTTNSHFDGRHRRHPDQRGM